MPRGAPSITAMPAILAILVIPVIPGLTSAADPPAPARQPPAAALADPRLLEAERLPWYSPPTLAYEDGTPIPPGYRLVSRRRQSLLAAGAALFGGSYLISALTAGTVVAGYDKHRIEVAPLFIPFAGPFVTLATSRDAQLNDVDRRTNGVLLLVDGVAQLTGAALFIVGIATREPFLARTKGSYRPAEARVMPEIFVGSRGAALRWQF